MNHVFYHSNCYDGFGAAYAHWKLHPRGSAEYHPVSYGGTIPDVSGETLDILDFSYPPETLLELKEKFSFVRVIDHHKTAIEKLCHLQSEPTLELVLDVKKSGALLTWERFSISPAPELIKHISDRDLWKFEIPGSKEVHRSLVSLPMDFEIWDKLDVEQLKKEGATLDRLYSRLVDEICKRAWKATIDGHETVMVNTSIAWSEVGDRLRQLYPSVKFVASFTIFNNSVMWSLRSGPDFDVSQVAKKFGGGGHYSAAGFKTARY